MSQYSFYSVRSSIFSRREQVIQPDVDDEPCCFVQNKMRTQLLLLDYKQFKAARTIQRHFRGHRARKAFRNTMHSAILIQRYWRYFTTKRRIILVAQDLTQDSMVIKFNISSLKIQAFFRGWWSRKYINNMQFLKEIRLNCMEDLLNGFVAKLHTQLRTGHLPGSMDYLRDYQLLVEELLSTLTYRFFNRYVSTKHAKSRALQQARKREFRNSLEWTWIPYPGYDHNGTCEPPPVDKLEPKYYTERENDVIQRFVAATRITTVHQSKLSRSKEKKKLGTKALTEYENDQRFCRDLIKSMRHWHACKICEVKVTPSLMNIHFNSFLNDVKHYLEDLKYVVNCNCQRDVEQDVHLPNCD